jgi:hypothetical protein
VGGLGRAAQHQRRAERVHVGVAAAVEEVAHQIAAPLEPVEALAVGQRRLDPQAMEGRAVEDASAAEAEVREQVRVRVHEAEQIAVVEGAARGLAGGVARELGEGRAALGRIEREHAGLLGVRSGAQRADEAPGAAAAQCEALRVVSRHADFPLRR